MRIAFKGCHQADSRALQFAAPEGLHDDPVRSLLNAGALINIRPRVGATQSV
jgi:hypothetical protein